MAEEVVPEIHPKPGPYHLEESTVSPDPDRLLTAAKKLAIDNYNSHRDKERIPAELTMDSVYIVWWAKTLNNWKAIVASSVARGFLWEVTSNGYRKEAYIEVYRKINSKKVLLKE